MATATLMAAGEYIVRFVSADRFREYRDIIAARVRRLPTYCGQLNEDTFHLVGLEPRKPGAWVYDVRFWLKQSHVFVEINAYPPSIETDLRRLMSWLREHGDIRVTDKVGDPAQWW